MKVKCLTKKWGDIQYRITQGKEYVVLGLSISSNRTQVKFWIKDDPGNYFVPTPCELFEIIDPRVSKLWIIKVDDKNILISANDFLDPVFLDCLTDFDETSVAAFKRVSALMEDEADVLTEFNHE